MPKHTLCIPLHNRRLILQTLHKLSLCAHSSFVCLQKLSTPSSTHTHAHREGERIEEQVVYLWQESRKTYQALFTQTYLVYKLMWWDWVSINLKVVFTHQLILVYIFIYETGKSYVLAYKVCQLKKSQIFEKLYSCI